MRLPDLDLRLYLPKPPFWLVALLLVSVVASWIPVAMIAKQRVSKHREPRYHIFLDMDNQAKYKTQKASEVFADGRTMRPRVPGTVARGELRADMAYEFGYAVSADGATQYVSGFPGQDVSYELVVHGQQQYDIFCTPCHGHAGFGDGMIQQRALALTERGNTGTSWTTVANLHQQAEDGSLTFGEAAYPNGKLYNTIANGKGAMSGYASQIPPADRWAIVAYVRALQKSQNPQGATPVALNESNE